MVNDLRIWKGLLDKRHRHSHSIRHVHGLNRHRLRSSSRQIWLRQPRNWPNNSISIYVSNFILTYNWNILRLYRQQNHDNVQPRNHHFDCTFVFAPPAVVKGQELDSGGLLPGLWLAVCIMVSRTLGKPRLLHRQGPNGLFHSCWHPHLHASNWHLTLPLNPWRNPQANNHRLRLLLARNVPHNVLHNKSISESSAPFVG